MNYTKHGNVMCDKENCFGYCQARLFVNHCKVLDEVPFYPCPFFKTKEQIKGEMAVKRARARRDAYFRTLMIRYGEIKGVQEYE